jgi:hypothetical protein
VFKLVKFKMKTSDKEKEESRVEESQSQDQIEPIFIYLRLGESVCVYTIQAGRVRALCVCEHKTASCALATPERCSSR